MKKLFLFLLIVVLALSLFAAGCEPPDRDETVASEEFYDGSTVNFYAGGTGGSTDIYVRAVARYFEKATGARVLVTNFDGAGGMEAINEVYRAEADGLTIAGWILSSTWMNAILEDEAVLFDPEELTYLGTYQSVPWAIWTYSEGDYNSIEKLLDGEDLLLAGASPLGFFAFWGTVAGRILDLDFTTVTGVGGPPAVKLSLMQEETQFGHVTTNIPDYYPDLLPLLINGTERDSRFPDVPTMPEVVDEYLGRTLTEDEEVWVTFADIQSQFSQAGLMMPPGVPQERVDYVRAVLDEIAADEDFIDEVKNLLGLDSWTWIPSGGVEESLQFMLDNEDDFHNIYDWVFEYYQ